MPLDELDLGEGHRVVVDGSAEELRVGLFSGGRASATGDGAYAALLGWISKGEAGGAFEARGPRAAPHLGYPVERAIEVDQSNVSVVVGDAAVVKVFPKVLPGPHPGLDVPQHLSAVGFTETPAALGTLTWSRDGVTALLASAAAYLPGATDGWDWFVDEIERRDYGAATASAAAMGDLVARLHRGLATPSPIFPEPVAVGDATAWRAPSIAVLEEAVELTTGEPGERLRAHGDEIRVAFDGFVGDTKVMRIHGDLHVGQILRWDGGLAVSDFDGNPLAPPEARVAPAPPARDVASMARAIDHAGRIVQRRDPSASASVEAWIAEGRASFLEAYRASAADLLDERLLRPFEVAQECHEYVYAARYLPHWVDTPDRAMPALLDS